MFWQPCIADRAARTRTNDMSIHNTLQIALEHYQAGRLSQAEAVCRQILQADPNQPAALHFLGVIAIQVGNSEIASELIRKAISLKPDYIEAHFNLAIALMAQGKRDEAIARYRQVIALMPA